MITQPKLKLEDLKPGDRVYWSSRHNPEAKEYGTISSVNESFAFVKFDEEVRVNGLPGTTSKACNVNQLTLCSSKS